MDSPSIIYASRPISVVKSIISMNIFTFVNFYQDQIYL